MTMAEFKAIVDANGGESNVIGIMFDNGLSYTYTAPDRLFTYDKFVDEANECIIETAIDCRSNAYRIVKHVENVQAILFAEKSLKTGDYIPATAYDRQTIRAM